VDDNDVGRTPTVIRDLTEGPHIIHVERTGYEDHDRRIVLTRDRPSQLVNATLARQQPPPASRPATPAPTRSATQTPARTPTPFSRTPPQPPARTGATAAGRGSLTVESRPSGARVFLDGRLVGTTPLTWAGIPAGDHSIRLEHDGYTNWTGSVRVVSNETARVTGSMER